MLLLLPISLAALALACVLIRAGQADDAMELAAREKAETGRLLVEKQEWFAGDLVGEREARAKVRL